MASSNSGSFQSSSGGAGDNDDYDSTTTTTTTHSISSFFNPPTTNFNHHLIQPPPPTTFYTNPDPSPSSSPWTIPPDFSTFTTTTTTTTMDHHHHHHHHNNIIINSHTNTPQPKPTHHQIGVSIKNPKKRTRASRRAPTTVLTTDTTNFRQMVQEFTGIPTAPFSPAAPFSRRLDLIGSLRPPFLNSAATTTTNNTTTTTNNNHHNHNHNHIITTAATTSGNYNFAPSTLNAFHKQPSSFLDLQNQHPMFSFQSLLQNSSLPQQTNDHLSSTSSKRSFEGVIGNTQNIGGSKLNSGLENVVASSSADQVQGNHEASWICPSN